MVAVLALALAGQDLIDLAKAGTDELPGIYMLWAGTDYLVDKLVGYPGLIDTATLDAWISSNAEKYGIHELTVDSEPVFMSGEEPRLVVLGTLPGVDGRERLMTMHSAVRQFRELETGKTNAPVFFAHIDPTSDWGKSYLQQVLQLDPTDEARVVIVDPFEFGVYEKSPSGSNVDFDSEQILDALRGVKIRDVGSAILQNRGFQKTTQYCEAYRTRASHAEDVDSLSYYCGWVRSSGCVTVDGLLVWLELVSRKKREDRDSGQE